MYVVSVGDKTSLNNANLNQWVLMKDEYNFKRADNNAHVKRRWSSLMKVSLYLHAEVLLKLIIGRWLEEQVVRNSPAEVAGVSVPQAAGSNQEGDDDRNRDTDRQGITEALYENPTCELPCNTWRGFDTVRLPVYAENGGGMFLRNVGNIVQVYRVLRWWR